MQNNSMVPCTLLRAPAETVRWVDGERKQIRRNHGVSLGRTAIARAALSALRDARVSFASCRSEAHVQDMIRDLARSSAAATEVK